MIKTRQQLTGLGGSVQVIHKLGQRPIVQRFDDGLTLELSPRLFVRLQATQELTPLIINKSGTMWRPTWQNSSKSQDNA